MSATGHRPFFASLIRRFQPAAPRSETPAGGEPTPGNHEEVQALGEFVTQFTRMVGAMEERFVPLGEDMGNIVRHLQSLAQAAGDGFGALREEISTGSLGELDVRANATIALLKQQLGSMTLRMQPLTELDDDLHRLNSLGNDVQRIGAFLHACGSSFAVESARAEESRAAFATFVKELRELAVQIGGLAERMDQDSRSTLLQLKTARRRIADNIAELGRLSSAMGGAFAIASGEIQRLTDGMCSVLDRVERHRLAIATQTGSVIYYLQFGDLVRQKCEHVLAAARDAASPSATGPQALIIRTSAAQLALIQREVDEARERLGLGYAGLARELSELAECGRNFSATGPAGTGDAWGRLKSRLEDLGHIQQREAQLNQDAVQTAGDAGSAAAALHAGLGGVREMSSHLHLLALNAIIQTVHLGDQGRTLEELAQHVDGLHRTCDTIVPEVLGLLETIAHRVATFTDRGSEDAAFDLGGLQQIERAQDCGRSVMQEILTLATSGEEMIQTAVRRLVTLDALSAEIDTHHATLSRIAACLPEASAEDSETARSLDARMLDRYTMQSERDAHQRAHGREAAGPPVETVEFFSLPGDGSTAEPALATAAGGDADLGDNIELF